MPDGKGLCDGKGSVVLQSPIRISLWEQQLGTSKLVNGMQGHKMYVDSQATKALFQLVVHFFGLPGSFYHDRRIQSILTIQINNGNKDNY